MMELYVLYKPEKSQSVNFLYSPLIRREQLCFS